MKTEEAITLTEAAKRLGLPFCAVIRAVFLKEVRPDFTSPLPRGGFQVYYKTSRLPEIKAAFEETRDIGGPLPPFNIESK